MNKGTLFHGSLQHKVVKIGVKLLALNKDSDIYCKKSAVLYFKLYSNKDHCLNSTLSTLNDIGLYELPMRQDPL